MSESDENYSKDLEGRIEELEKIIDLEFEKNKGRVKMEAMSVWKIAFNSFIGVRPGHRTLSFDEVIGQCNKISDLFIEHFKDK